MHPGNETKVKQPLRGISLICSYMHTFLIKVNNNMIKILEVRWLGTKLMQIFKATTTSDESYPGSLLGMMTKPHTIELST